MSDDFEYVPLKDTGLECRFFRYGQWTAWAPLLLDGTSLVARKYMNGAEEFEIREVPENSPPPVWHGPGYYRLLANYDDSTVWYFKKEPTYLIRWPEAYQAVDVTPKEPS